MLQNLGPSYVLDFSKSGKFVRDVHHAVAVIRYKFREQPDTGFPRLPEDVVQHDRAHAPVHHPAGHEQQFDRPYLRTAFHQGKANFSVIAELVSQLRHKQEMAVRTAQLLQLFPGKGASRGVELIGAVGKFFRPGQVIGAQER